MRTLTTILGAVYVFSLSQSSAGQAGSTPSPLGDTIATVVHRDALSGPVMAPVGVRARQPVTTSLTEELAMERPSAPATVAYGLVGAAFGAFAGFLIGINVCDRISSNCGPGVFQLGLGSAAIGALIGGGLGVLVARRQ